MPIVFLSVVMIAAGPGGWFALWLITKDWRAQDRSAKKTRAERRKDSTAYEQLFP